MSSREQGFGLVGVLVLLPFLVSLLSFIAGAALLLKSDARLKHECRSSVLNSQRKVADDLKSLMALNPRAQLLRVERKAAELDLKVAISSQIPAAVAAARLHLAGVQAMQAALAAQQKLLIARAKLRSAQAPGDARTAVQKGLQGEAADHRVQVPALRLRNARPAFFDVVADPPKDPTPDYKPSPKFTAKQTVDLNVDLEIGSLLPDWLRKLLPTGGLKLNTHCQGTIEKQENEWIETLNAVR